MFEVVVLIGAIVAAVTLISALLFRTVVSTNDVHIVQSAKKTVSYGKDQPAGNTYYKWPSWIPFIGIKVQNLPVSVFDVQLESYAAYDKGRVPFVIDIMAFFRIKDSNVAAQRVHTFQELTTQLEGILQGAARSILAKSEIEEILEERSLFGLKFTEAVDDQLKEWGVSNVKNIELMDIRDAQDSNVIQNIMAKKKSLIDMQSRVEVAKNKQAAQEAEINAQRAVDMRKQEALETVGVRTAEKDQKVGISTQQATQAIKEQEKVTAQKHMEVVQVNEVRAAEIAKNVQIVKAEQEQKTMVIKAEGQKQQTITVAEGQLGQAKLHAEGVRVEGEAKGKADQAVLMAPVNSQIALAKEIGENKPYQEYLLSVRTIEKDQVVGSAQAEALKDAQIKVIANSGSVQEGVTNVMDLLTSKGGTQLGAMLEAFIQTDAGKAVVAKLTAPPVK